VSALASSTITLFPKTQPAEVKKLRHRLEHWLVESFATAVTWIPRHVCLVITQVIGMIAYLADARGRSTALENVRLALPHLSWLQRHGVVRRAYQNFARTFADLFWSQTLTPENVSEHIEYRSDAPDLEQAVSQGAIWVTPHYGNFELASLYWSLQGRSMSVVAQNFKNPALTEVFRRLRSGHGHTLIPQEGAMIRLLKALKRKGHTAFLTDLTLRPSQATVAIECFGRWTCVTLMHTLLAQRTGLPLVPAVCEPLPDGRYIMHSLTPIYVSQSESLIAATQRVWAAFEPLIRHRPHLWMWMYKHWRYLPSESPDPFYPDYSNVQRSFMKRVNEAILEKMH
jgi:Kdo2-lipid IVA lauroyltransferase/acyltransferase